LEESEEDDEEEEEDEDAAGGEISLVFIVPLDDDYEEAGEASARSGRA
jgi:hypothetical protein